jgi:hypothetical protein
LIWRKAGLDRIYCGMQTFVLETELAAAVFAGIENVKTVNKDGTVVPP